MAKRVVKPRVCLVCSNEALAALHAASLQRDGFDVTVADAKTSAWIGYFRDLPVGAVVIDLDRLPSFGREVGLVLRGSKSTRHLPLVYCGGIPEKVERLRHELPEAIYAEWSGVRDAIRRSVQGPGAQLGDGQLEARTARTLPALQHRRDADLARRLGVVKGVEVLASGNADFLLELLDPLPDGVVIRDSDEMDRSSWRSKASQDVEAAPRLWLCVTRSRDEVRVAFDVLQPEAHPKTSAWIVHPKQASRYHVDFNQNDVRDIGLAIGWVDFKVCAVDQDWSGLKFARRKPDQAPQSLTKSRMMKSTLARKAAARKATS